MDLAPVPLEGHLKLLEDIDLDFTANEETNRGSDVLANQVVTPAPGPSWEAELMSYPPGVLLIIGMGCGILLVVIIVSVAAVCCRFYIPKLRKRRKKGKKGKATESRIIKFSKPVVNSARSYRKRETAGGGDGNKALITMKFSPYASPFTDSISSQEWRRQSQPLRSTVLPSRERNIAAKALIEAKSTPGSPDIQKNRHRNSGLSNLGKQKSSLNIHTSPKFENISSENRQLFDSQTQSPSRSLPPIPLPPPPPPPVPVPPPPPVPVPPPTPSPLLYKSLAGVLNKEIGNGKRGRKL